MEPNKREAMTPDPEMTLERAKEIVGQKWRPDKNISLTRKKYIAQGFLSGHAAGVKESQALVKELVEAAKMVIAEYSNLPVTGPDTVIIRAIDDLQEALESARRIPQMTHTIIDIGEYRFSQSQPGSVWFEHSSGEGMELTPEIVDRIYKENF